MKRYRYLIFSIVITMVTICGGCSRKADSRLLHAEAIMEEHPDSALILLDSMELPENASEYDRHLYELLFSHSRYKNFIDIENDSSLREAVDYFEHENIAEEATKALFVLGMTQMEAKKLGEAAVLFTKGLDIARNNGCFMWEGQNARGLYRLYGKLLDSSAQLKYASKAYEAFSKGGYETWADWSLLEVAVASNNNGLFDKSKGIANKLLKKSIVLSDTILLEESVHLLGLTSFNSGDYQNAIKYYTEIFNLNPCRLTEADLRHISVSLSNVDKDSLPDDARTVLDDMSKLETYKPSFVVLADQGRFEEAYEDIYQYKNKQDSVFSVILKNNVSESIATYDNTIKKMREERLKKERALSFAIVFAIVMVVIIVYLFLHVGMIRRQKEIEREIADIESLKKDLQLQLERNQANIDKEGKNAVSASFIRHIRENYSQVNTLCDSYYQLPKNSSAKDRISTEADKIIQDFTNEESLKEIETYVDSISEGLYSSFKKELYYINEDGKRLFLYLLVGFSNRSISVLLHQNTGAIYTKKFRLKGRIEKSDACRKREYLEVFK